MTSTIIGSSEMGLAETDPIHLYDVIRLQTKLGSVPATSCEKSLSAANKEIYFVEEETSAQDDAALAEVFAETSNSELTEEYTEFYNTLPFSGQELTHQVVKYQKLNLSFEIAEKLWRQAQQHADPQFLTKLRARRDHFKRRREVVANVLVMRTTRLINSIAQRYNWNENNKMDYLQAGREGLLYAISKFDPYAGFEFSTYAIWWIKHYIAREAYNLKHSVGIPYEVYVRTEQIKKMVRKRQQQLKRELTTTEIKEIELELEIAKRVKKVGPFKNQAEEISFKQYVLSRPLYSFESYSIDKPVDEESNGVSIVDFLQSEAEFADPELMQIRESELRRVQAVLDIFPDSKFAIKKRAFVLKYFSDLIDENYRIIIDFYSNAKLQLAANQRSTQDDSAYVNGDITSKKIGKILGITRQGVDDNLNKFVPLVLSALEDPLVEQDLRRRYSEEKPVVKTKKIPAQPSVMKPVDIKLELQNLYRTGQLTNEHLLQLNRKSLDLGRAGNLYFKQNMSENDIAHMMGFTTSAEIDNFLNPMFLELFKIYKLKNTPP